MWNFKCSVLDSGKNLALILDKRRLFIGVGESYKVHEPSWIFRNSHVKPRKPKMLSLGVYSCCPLCRGVLHYCNVLDKVFQI